MKVFNLIYFSIFAVSLSFSFELGGAFSLDYYNNPIENSAPSPIQQKLLIQNIVDFDTIHIRSGIGVLTSYYEVVEGSNVPVFGDYWSGFHTVEFDLFVYPGVSFDISESINIGFSAGGGLRLPIISKIDDDLAHDHEESFNWFYNDLHFLFAGGAIFSRIKLPFGEGIRLFTSINYNYFITRESQWTLGATAGLLWQIN